MNNKKKPQPSQENAFLGIAFNILLPMILLMKGDRYLPLSPSAVLMLALAFPVGYYLLRLWRTRRSSLLAIIGFFSILLTGGIGLLELPRAWFIAKEGGIPLLIALVVVGSEWIGKPLVRSLLFNDTLLHTARIEEAIRLHNNQPALQQLLRSSTWLIAASFVFSAAINFITAATIVTVEPWADKVLFNEQVGKMTGITAAIVLVPSLLITGFALWRLLKGLTRLTGLPIEALLVGAETSTAPSPPEQAS